MTLSHRPDGEEQCCEEDLGGSHYHCARCDNVTGMYGHMTSFCKVFSKPGKFSQSAPRHMCCPDNCELLDRDAILEHINFWSSLGEERGTDYSFVIADYLAMLSFTDSTLDKP